MIIPSFPSSCLGTHVGEAPASLRHEFLKDEAGASKTRRSQAGAWERESGQSLRMKRTWSAIDFYRRRYGEGRPKSSFGIRWPSFSRFVFR